MAGSGTAHLRPSDDILLRAENLVVEFPVGSTGLKVHAVSDVSLDIKEGETLGLVGESGCGKSTTGRALMQMPRPTAVRSSSRATSSPSSAGTDLRSVRPRMQMIFQDPISSLNPRRRVYDIVAEPLRIWKRGTKEEQRKTVNETLEAVGIPPDTANRRPHQFSGGQCQRISIARAVVLDPKVIICDEPVSALDVSVQAQILNLLEDMKQRYGLTLVFIAHDLAVVKNVSDRVAVMYLGKLCEVAPPDELYARPAHPYTAALLTLDPGGRPDGAAARGDHARRRDPVAGRTTERLPVPHPLRPGPGHVRAGRAEDAPDRPRPLRGVPLPARRRREACRPPSSPRRLPTRRADSCRSPLAVPGSIPRFGASRSSTRPSWCSPSTTPARSPSNRSPRRPACRVGSSTTTSVTRPGCSPRYTSATLDRLVEVLDVPLRTRTRRPTQRLRAVVEVYLRFATENPSAWKLIGTAEATEHPSVRRARRDASRADQRELG